MSIENVKLPDIVVLVVPLIVVPDGERVTKKTGTYPLIVSREIRIHSDTPGERKFIKAENGTVFLTSETNFVKAHSGTMEVCWEVEKKHLCQMLNNDRDCF